MRFIDYCRQAGIALEDRNFTLEYESTIPLRLGMGGSSAIITAALRALCQYFGVEIPLPVQANLVLETETKELGVPAGPQDRVIQAYEGLVYMDFARELMETAGLRPLRAARSGAAAQPVCRLPHQPERGHGGLPQQRPGALASRRPAGGRSDADLGELCRAGPRRLAEPRLRRPWTASSTPTSTSARSVYDISEGNLRMIQAARQVGATANFAGSGGAIVGTYEDEPMYDALVSAMRPLGVAVVKPRILP